MYIFLRNTMLGLCGFCFLVCPLIGETEREPADKILPDETIQDKIDEIIRQLKKGDGPESFNVVEAAKELRESFPDRPGQLIIQMLIYENSVGDERLAHTADFVLIELARDLRKRKTIFDIAPFLSTGNQSIKHRLHELMDYNCCNGGPKIDYSRIFGLMKANRGKLPDGLVEYMFERSPEKAFLGYARFFSVDDKPFLLAEHEISEVLWMHRNHLLNKHVVLPDALSQLKRLSMHDAWWARLYVAQIMRQHEGFRRPEIIQRLKKDDHPLVRKAMGFETEEPQP